MTRIPSIIASLTPAQIRQLVREWESDQTGAAQRAGTSESLETAPACVAVACVAMTDAPACVAPSDDPACVAQSDAPACVARLNA